MKHLDQRSLTESQTDTVLGALMVGADMALAAKAAGISRQKLYECRAASETLKERIDEAKACADDVVVKSLYTKATVDKDVTAMIFWLKNRRPLEWRDRRELNLTADVKSAAARKAAELGLPVEAIQDILAVAQEIATDATPEGFVQ